MFIIVFQRVNLPQQNWIHQKQEALKDCEEFRPVNPNQVVEFIELAISKVLERTEAARSTVGLLFFNILKEKKFDTASFTKALKNTLETAEDMAIDVPKIATYLAQIIGKFLKSFRLTFEFFFYVLYEF